MKDHPVVRRTVIAVLLIAMLLGCVNVFAARKAILLAAFGTTVPGANKSYKNIERFVKQENPGIPIYWAYTSNKVRAILKKRGITKLSVSEALTKMRKDGITEAVVQSLHMVTGLEYKKKILQAVKQFQTGKNSFKKLVIGKPMLLTAATLRDFCRAMLSILPKSRKPQDAILLMGHNHENAGTDLFYIAAGLALQRQDPNIFVATVEGKPDFEDALKELKASKAKKVYLMPMLVVAGDHAKNDLAGDEEDSWKKQLQKQGFTCVPVLKGLGEYPVFAKIYAAHVKAALKELNE